MEVLTKNDKENLIEIKIRGEGHTLCVPLRAILFEDQDVEFAGYRIKHPLMPEPTLYVKTNGKKTPIKALKDAIKKLIERSDEFALKFSEVFEEFNVNSS
ncbi:MAG: DNA-directed RNA polymerase subunit L [Candidatus Helarchaeota archaeon]|nr:DNA-directed RNA polymerase subunit L [Candidatus Helarchaeota archaeon]